MTSDVSQHATLPDLSGITLERTYKFSDEELEKMHAWGHQLWRLLRANLVFEPPRLLRNGDETEFIAERFTNYALARLTARGMLTEKGTDGLSDDAKQEAYSDAVEEILDVDNATRDRAVWLLRRICARHRRKGGELTRSQIRTVSNFASSERHRCYICGCELSFDDLLHPTAPSESGEVDWRTFEIDHLIPQSKGGGRDPANLAACCQLCNKFKDDFLSFVDLPLETYITSSVKEANVRAMLGTRGRFALLWRQKGRCALCEEPFHNASNEKLVLQRKVGSDTYHFLNSQIICGIDQFMKDWAKTGQNIL